MFKEDIRLENLEQSIKILRNIGEPLKPEILRLLYFYNMNSKDEVNVETKIIKNEVMSGMTDPVRTAAIIELQNFIKKNVGKKQILSKIAQEGSNSMMVQSINKFQ